MKNPIRHEGVVIQVGNGLVRVKIMQTSACAACKVVAHCQTAEAKEKVVDVVGVANAERWHEGDRVVVSTQAGMAGKALLVGFGLPLVFMLLTLVVSMAAGCSEGVSALLMIGVLIPYYIIVWLCRHHLARTISFQIEE